MNTPRLRRGGGIASSSGLFLLASGTLICLVCDSASKLERWALLPFGGFPALICFLFS